MVYPKLTVGSARVIDHGRLPFLEEEGFRALASELGDADVLLQHPAVIGY